MLNDIFSANENVYVEELDDGAMLHAEDKVHILNNTAFFVWLHCDGKTDVQGIIETVKQSFPVATICPDDIVKIINIFKTEGLVS